MKALNLPLVVHPAWYFIIIDDRILFIVRIFFVAIGMEVGSREETADCRILPFAVSPLKHALLSMMISASPSETRTFIDSDCSFSHDN